MLELQPVDRPSAKDCLSDPWIGTAIPLVQSGMEPNVPPVGQRSLDTTSEQPTEICGPMWQTMEGPGLPTPAPIFEGSRKHFRSSKSTSATQAIKRVQRRPQAEISSGSNVTDLLVDEIYKLEAALFIWS